MSTLRFKRDELIDALEGRRKWAADRDAKALKKHLADEKKWHREFTSRCRELSKKSYDELKEIRERSRYDFLRNDTPPSCPTSTVAELDRLLNVIRASRQQSFAISNGGQWHRMFWVLTHDDAIDPDMCS